MHKFKPGYHQLFVDYSTGGGQHSKELKNLFLLEQRKKKTTTEKWEM